MAKRKKRRRKISGYLLLLVTGVLLLPVILVALVIAGVFGPIPTEEELRSIQNPIASEVYTVDSLLMGKYYLQNRQDLRPDEISPTLVATLIATEDARFYDPMGIDLRSLFRVLFKSILLGDRSSGGGSTISQQLVKNLYPRGDYGFLRMPVNKIREMTVALTLERMYSKQEILALYLNTVPFGENTFGIKSASQRFFNKNPKDLATEEGALLVGMLKATNYYNPQRHTERAMSRRNVVLQQMGKNGILAPQMLDSLQNLPVQLDYTPLTHNTGAAPYFRERLRIELEQWCRKVSKARGQEYNLYTDGLKIYTTIHSRLQTHAKHAVDHTMKSLQQTFNAHWENRTMWTPHLEQELLRRHLEAYGPANPPDSSLRRAKLFTWEGVKEAEVTLLDSLKHYMEFLQAGLVALDVETGAVRAWVGGINHTHFKYDHVTAARQVGSTFKPLVYLAALEEGMSPCDFVENDSVVYSDYDDWTPRNADREYGGHYSLKGALTNSINTVSVKLLLRTGISTVHTLARKAGIEAGLPSVPSLALGTADISLLEITEAYQAIANRGVHREPFYLLRIEDRNGRELYVREHEDEEDPAFSELNADRMICMLQNVVDSGTARGARRRLGARPAIAGKTGTTQNHTDGWFIGFTPRLVAGVWVGGDFQNVRFRTLQHGQGAATALPVWTDFMGRVYDDPEFKTMKSDTFTIDPEVRQDLECPDFKERRFSDFVPLKKFNPVKFFKRLFGRKERSGQQG